MAQYFAIAEATIYGYIPANHYFSSLHSIVAEAEDGVFYGTDTPVPLFTAVPQFSGRGYTNITTDGVLLLI